MEQKIISLSPKNITDEHICCAFSDKKCAVGYQAKKEWLTAQFGPGYRFKKLDVRGKVFIEYVPAEYSWLPIDAPNYMVVNCFWVSGQFKGKGYGKDLLQQCLDDSKDKDGVVVITGGKKRPFMSDTKFFKLQGFEKVDSADPYFELWAKKNRTDVPNPKFLDSARVTKAHDNGGFVVNYSDTCPFNQHYVNVVMKKFAEDRNLPLEIIKIENQDQARQMPVPWIIYSLFYKGEFLTHEIKSEKGLEKLLAHFR